MGLKNFPRALQGPPVEAKEQTSPTRHAERRDPQALPCEDWISLPAPNHLAAGPSFLQSRGSPTRPPSSAKSIPADESLILTLSPSFLLLPQWPLPIPCQLRRTQKLPRKELPAQLLRDANLEASGLGGSAGDTYSTVHSRNSWSEDPILQGLLHRSPGESTEQRVKEKKEAEGKGVADSPKRSPRLLGKASPHSHKSLTGD